MRHRNAPGLFAKSAHRRLRLADEFPAVPEEPHLSRVGWRRQHDVRSRKPGNSAYSAGNLFHCFPWLKPKARGQNVVWPSVAPTDAMQYVQASPIPNTYLPLSEYFCDFVLKAPSSNFIGFQLDEPLRKGREKLAWVTNVDKLADGAPVGINWTSSNINRPWFGGNSSIPDTDACNGNAWRKVIVDGLNQGLCWRLLTVWRRCRSDSLQRSRVGAHSSARCRDCAISPRASFWWSRHHANPCARLARPGGAAAVARLSHLLASTISRGTPKPLS